MYIYKIYIYNYIFISHVNIHNMMIMVWCLPTEKANAVEENARDKRRGCMHVSFVQGTIYRYNYHIYNCIYNCIYNYICIYNIYINICTYICIYILIICIRSLSIYIIFNWYLHAIWWCGDVDDDGDCNDEKAYGACIMCVYICIYHVCQYILIISVFDPYLYI